MQENAKVGIPTLNSEDEEGESGNAIDSALAESGLFTDKAEKVFRYLQCNVVLAPFHKVLEDLVDNQSLPDDTKLEGTLDAAKLW